MLAAGRVRYTVVMGSQPGDAAWIDVSVTVRHGMPHWPDNPPIVMQRAMEIARGHACNLSHLAMGVHSGTHIDAPVHFIHQAAGVDEMPLTATIGSAGIWIIEGLDLSAVRAGRYEMICLPVKLHGSDGAPARALLRPLETAEDGG